MHNENNTLENVKSIVDRNRSQFEKEANKLDEAEKMVQGNNELEDAWAQICPQTELERLECQRLRKDTNETNDEQISQFTQYRTQMARADALALLRSWNKEESAVFYKIQHWCLQKVNGENPQPLKVLITGRAGTGKSRLIKAIYYVSTRILKRLHSDQPDAPTVVLTAPTGVAAYNIHASAIHNTFSIGADLSNQRKKLTPYVQK